MSFRTDISESAEKDIDKHISSGDKVLLKKIHNLIEELKLDPRRGTGKPEQLRHQSREIWSRRISDKHRLVYEILDDARVVRILRAYGHYGDK